MSYQDITVVITTFRSQNKIISCLESINPDVKTIIIENSNSSEFKEKIEKNYKNVRCFLAGENLGYAKGNNFGLTKVKTMYALILNPDAVLDTLAISNFLKSAQKYADFSIIGPHIQKEELNTKEKKVSNFHLTETKSVKGFAMFLNLKQFESIGFFDEKIFIYLEEIDLCRRLKKLNKKIYLDPSIHIFHRGGSSHDEEINYEMELSRNWHWMWSSFYFSKKHYGYFYAFIKFLPKVFSSLFKVFFYTLTLNKLKRSIYAKRFSGLINSIMGKKSWYRPKIT